MTAVAPVREITQADVRTFAAVIKSAAWRSVRDGIRPDDLHLPGHHPGPLLVADPPKQVAERLARRALRGRLRIACTHKRCTVTGAWSAWSGASTCAADVAERCAELREPSCCVCARPRCGLHAAATVIPSGVLRVPDLPPRIAIYWGTCGTCRARTARFLARYSRPKGDTE